jgi:hypothetical protein
MSLGKRVLSQVQLILPTDDAVGEKCDYPKYLETLDRQYLDLRSDVQPTVFTARPLTYRQRMEMEGVSDLAPRCEMAIRCGLVEVSNYLVLAADGSQVTLPPIVRQDDLLLGAKVISKDWLAEANFPTAQFYALANAIAVISSGSLPKS